MNKGSAQNLDAFEDDEEVAWESNDIYAEDEIQIPESSSVRDASNDSLSTQSDPEKELMRKQIRALVSRVSDLEKELSIANDEICRLKSTGPLANISKAQDEVVEKYESHEVNESDMTLSIPKTQEEIEKIEDVIDRADAIDRKEVIDHSNSNSTSTLANLDDEEWDNSWS